MKTMDIYDATQALVTEFGVDQTDAMKAVEFESQDVIDNAKQDRRRVSQAVATQEAYSRVASWLRDADQYAVKLDWADLARFAGSHRKACVWAVFTGKSIKGVAK